MLYFFIMKKIVVKNKDLKILSRKNSKFKKKNNVTIFIWQHILFDVKCLTFWQRHRVLLIILEIYVISCFINSIFVNYNIYYSSFFKFLTNQNQAKVLHHDQKLNWLNFLRVFESFYTRFISFMKLSFLSAN